MAIENTPRRETILAFVAACQKHELGEPHFVLLRKDSKLPAYKGYMDNPVSCEDVLANLDRFDVGIIPASLGRVVLDNDEGGPHFVKYACMVLGRENVTITPSSSGDPNRGHIWVGCVDAFQIGNDAIYEVDARVGELRASRGYVRLTNEALRVLIDSKTFWVPAFLGVEEEHIRKFTKSKKTSFKPVDLGEDRGVELTPSVEEAMQLEFEDRPERRSELIYKWVGTLTRRGHTPAEIVRFLSGVPAVVDKRNDKSYNLADDVCRTIGKQDAQGDFDGLTGDFTDPDDEFSDWVWVSSVERFFRKSDGLSFTTPQFLAHFQHLACGRQLKKAIFNNQTSIKKFESCTYLPSQPQDLGNQFNSWRPSNVIANEGDTTLIERHMELMFPDPVERELFLDFLHYVLVRRGTKLQFAMVVHGQQGIGKSAVARLVERVLGEHNVSFPSQPEFKERFTGWQQNSELAVIEELMMGGKFELGNRLKPVITDKTLRIELKGENAYSLPNRLNMMAFTNHKNAICLEEDDRRWLVLSSPMVRQDDAYYDALWTWIESDEAPGAFLHWLEQRCPTLNPNGVAPTTSAKQDMLEASRPAFEQQLKQWTNDKDGPFAHDLFRFDDVQNALAESGFRPRANEVSPVLGQLGAVKHERPKQKGMKSSHVWSIRNHGQWASMTAKERWYAYDAQA